MTVNHEVAGSNPAASAMKVIQKWLGIIIDADDSICRARLRDLTNSELADEEITFDIEKIDNRELVEVGAEFYLCIYENNELTLRFRELPRWTEKEISDAIKEAEELEVLFCH